MNLVYLNTLVTLRGSTPLLGKLVTVQLWKLFLMQRRPRIWAGHAILNKPSVYSKGYHLEWRIVTFVLVVVSKMSTRSLYCDRLRFGFRSMKDFIGFIEFLLIHWKKKQMKRLWVERDLEPRKVTTFFNSWNSKLQVWRELMTAGENSKRICLCLVL